MAENEAKKEKKGINMNIWFLVFLVYLIISLAYIFNLRSDLTNIEKAKQQEIQTLQTSNYELTSKLYKVKSDLDTIYSLLAETKIDLNSILSSGDKVQENVEISNGTYTGTAAFLSGDESVEVSMSLTLAEDNLATLVKDNDMVSEGSFLVSENAVVFNILYFRNT